MKTPKLPSLIILSIVFGAVAHSQAEQIVPITAITGSNGGDQYANGMVSINNGSGITKADPLDPSTWTFSGSDYKDEWMAWYLKVGGVVTPGLNGKLAWASLDFGSTQALGELHIFNNNYQGGPSGVATFNLYHADAPAVALPAQPAKNTFATTGLTPQGDYNFSSGGWTLFNTQGALTADKAGITTVDLPGVSARYLAIEILTNHGDTYNNGRVGFDEIAVTAAPPDTDGDGMPDEFELAHTDPQSPTALAPGDDLEPDGLTNLQEYLAGTDPNDPDSDDDTLNDGPELAGAGIRPPTDPLLADTDGDTLSDAVESNSGVFVSTADPGTSPVNADTDGDGFRDDVETNTGILVDAGNPGTSPLDPDSDDDNAYDWYEVAASLTSPHDPADKPNIPYPLPDPDVSTGATDKPVKVYIMSGQSNMVGFGTVSGTGDGTLATMTTGQNKFPNLIDGNDAWTTRQDVRYRGVIADIAKVQLSPGTLGSTFGPELGFGYIMGWLHDEPVLLLKSSIGNRSLGWDCLPPGSDPFLYGGTYRAGYGDYGNWAEGASPPAPTFWYAGKQFDDYFVDEADMGPSGNWADSTLYQHPSNYNPIQVWHNGILYGSKLNHTSTPDSEPGVGSTWTDYWNVYSVFNAVDVLDNFATEYPDWASQGFEIAGFVWWQGDKDRYDLALATRYEPNLVNLITSLRNYYTNRYPGKVVNNAPFVLATLGQTPLDSTDPAEKAILDAQLAVDGEAGNYPQFDGNVKTVYAHPLSQGGASNGHYNGHAGTYMLVGDALGRAMHELVENVTPPGDGYATWQSTNGATGQTLDQDHDDDGVRNGIEFFLGGPTGNTTGFTALPGVSKSGSVFSITWTKAAGYTGSYGPDFVVETSNTLTGTWTPEALGVNVAISGNNVTYTFPAPIGVRKFARLKVTGP